jgi:hypothetical protein
MLKVPFALGASVPSSLREETKTTLANAKWADTALAASIVSMHAPVPKQLPDQPVNSEPDAGAAVKVTLLPGSSEAEHAEPQSIPAGGPELTRPEPVPVMLTRSGYPVSPGFWPPQEISAEAKSKGARRRQRNEDNRLVLI